MSHDPARVNRLIDQIVERGVARRRRAMERDPHWAALHPASIDWMTEIERRRLEDLKHLYRQLTAEPLEVIRERVRQKRRARVEQKQTDL